MTNARATMQAHDEPELRRQVREQLLYPTKPKQGPVLSAVELACLCGGWRRGRSVAYLSQRYGIPEAIVRDVVGWADETAA